MIANQLMRRLAPAVLSIVWITSSFAAEGAAEGEDPLLDESRAVVARFASELQTELKAALSEQGPVGAISVCAERAPEIAARLSRESGAKVSRTSLKTRNSANAPEPWQADALHEFDVQSRTAEGPREQFLRSDDGSVRYLKPIVTGPICLACHGESIGNDVKEALDTHYPFDRARGYSTGDVRGAFSVVWPSTTR
jgi:hypothetical protein